MLDTSPARAYRPVADEEVSRMGVYFRMPRRKSTIPFNLRQEASQRKEPLFVETVCGIVGQLQCGRKFLADRFRRLHEGVMKEIDNIQLCYVGNFKMIYRGKPVQASVKAYIIPPPHSDPEIKDLYIRASHQFSCLLFAFDVTKLDSFLTAENCVRNMNVSLPDKYFFVGNKCDLRGTVPKGEEVEQRFAQTRALQFGAKGYFECSAKNNINVRPILEAIVRCELDPIRV